MNSAADRPSPKPSDQDERLALLADALDGDARDDDVADLAARFELPPELVEDAIAAARAFDEAFGEDLPPDLAAPIPLPPGYELVAELGRGGMGVVYRVRHRALGRDVALKALRLAGPDAPTKTRFDREVRALARLRHPHIVRVFEGGEVDGVMYYTMELIDGVTLTELTPTGIGVARSVRLLTRIADAVEHAHQHGIVHRDLKPSNILIDGDGEPFVVDFGLARDAGYGADPAYANAPTLTGQVVGTPAYMSPEQAAGVPAGEAADIYALGTILYECLTTKRPFADAPVPELLWRVMHEEPPRPGSIVPAIPRALEVICQHAMRKDPSRRYPSAQALRADLERFAAGRPIQAQPPGPVERAQLWLQRRASHLLTAALAILVAALATHAILDGATPAEIAAERMAAAEEFAARGDHGVARAAAYDALTHYAADHDRAHAAVAWLRATSSRAAEVLRLGRPERAQPLLDECRAEEPRIRQLLETPRYRSAWRGALCFQWLRLQALAELSPSLTFDSDALRWDDIARFDDEDRGPQLLARSLDGAPGAERDASLALLLAVEPPPERQLDEWTARPLALIERWLIDALRRFDPDCPLQQNGNDRAAVERYAASAPPPFDRAATRLVEMLERQREAGERGSYVTEWQPLRAHLAVVARHDLGDLHVLWEETREFAGPTDWRIERDDRLPGPVPGTTIAAATRFGLTLGMLAIENRDRQGRVLHASLAEADINLALPHGTGLARTESDVFLVPGTTVSLGTMPAPWLLTAGHTTSLGVLLTIEDAGIAPSPGGLTGWRQRVRRSLRTTRAAGREPIAASELWPLVDPVLDLAITDSRDDARQLLVDDPETAPVERTRRWLEFARIALAVDGAETSTGARRPERHPAVDGAWIALTCDDAAIRAGMLDLIERSGRAAMLPAATRWQLETAAVRERWSLPPTVAAAVRDAEDPAAPSLLRTVRRLFEGPWPFITLAVVLVGLFGRELARWRRRTDSERRDQAAVFVVAIGVFSWLLSLDRDPLPLPLWLGPLIALLGAVWWTAALPADGPPQARRARRRVAVCYAAAVLASLVPGPAAAFTSVPIALGIWLMIRYVQATSKRRFEQTRKRLARNRPANGPPARATGSL